MRSAPSVHQTTGVVSKNDLGRAINDLVRFYGNPFPSTGDPGPFRSNLVRFFENQGRSQSGPGSRQYDSGILSNDPGRLADDASFTLVKTHS